jgi:hypothetical protein
MKDFLSYNKLSWKQNDHSMEESLHVPAMMCCMMTMCRARVREGALM